VHTKTRVDYHSMDVSDSSLDTLGMRKPHGPYEGV